MAIYSSNTASIAAIHCEIALQAINNIAFFDSKIFRWQHQKCIVFRCLVALPFRRPLEEMLE